jgi:hypothetical protein
MKSRLLNYGERMAVCSSAITTAETGKPERAAEIRIQV